MKGPIQRITRERTEARADAVVPSAWLRDGHVGHSWSGGTWFTKEMPTPSHVGGGPLLLMLGSDADTNAALLRHASNETVRTYAVVGPRSSGDSLQGAHAPNVLARRVPEVPASALHTPSGAQLWIGGGFSMKLDHSQADALRQTFLRLFWHEASEEVWLEGRQFGWRPVRGRPFDVPEVAATSAVRLESSDARLNAELHDAHVHLTAGEPPAAVPRRLWFPAGVDHHNRLERLTKLGADVRWSDRRLPDMAVRNAVGEVLLPGKRGRLRIRLTSAQAREASALLDVDGDWRFRTDLRVGDPGARHASFWLAGEAAPRTMEEVQEIEVPDVHATSLRDVQVAEPSPVPPPHPLALSARFRWIVVPPRIPSASGEDPLVSRWRSVDDAWTKRLETVRSALERSNDERSRLGTTFSRLVSALLGFKRTHDEVLAKVIQLESRRPSGAGPTETPSLLTQLDDLEAVVNRHQRDLQDAESKAREEEELEKQRTQWAAQVQRATQEVSRLREEVEREAKHEAELVAERSDIEARVKDAPPEENRDLEAKKKRNHDERTSNEKNLKKLRYDLDKHAKDAGRPFTFNPTKSAAKTQQQQGKRFVPQPLGGRASLSVPEDALPEVGTLRTHKGQRYLVIQLWEDLDRGELAATRLAAKLVAPENA
jgi:hypothetical protein